CLDERGEDAVNLHRGVANDHRVYQKPEEPLLPLWHERGRAPKRLAAEPLDGVLGASVMQEMRRPTSRRASNCAPYLRGGFPRYPVVCGKCAGTRADGEQFKPKRKRERPRIRRDLLGRVATSLGYGSPHNPKVVGSNPTPATNKEKGLGDFP